MVEELEQQKSDRLLFKDFKLYDLKLIRHAPSIATMVCRETVDGVENGKPFQWHINGSVTYANRNGKWVPVCLVCRSPCKVNERMQGEMNP